MTHKTPTCLATISEVYAEMSGYTTTDDFRADWHLHHDGKLYDRQDMLICKGCGATSLDAEIVSTYDGWRCEECEHDAAREADAEANHRLEIAGWIKGGRL